MVGHCAKPAPRSGPGSVARVPLLQGLARFNKKVTNRLTGLIAGWAPGFAFVHHVGRKTGENYRTPVNVFRRDDGDVYLFALTYGETEWLRNVLASGECVIETRRHRFRLVDPVVYTDPERRAVPAPVRLVLGFIDVDQFLSMRSAGSL
jgi:deazaflavin-dependent oxidoreductase (nitroreductase family)